MNLSQKTIPLILIGAGLVFGYAVGFRKGGERFSLKTAPLLNEARKYFQPLPEFTSLSGRVLEIKNRRIVLEAFLPQNPFEPVPLRRMVTLDDATKVVKITNKSSAGYEKEVWEYQKRLKASAGETIVNVKPPSLTEETPIPVSEIRAGDMILVEARDSIKIREEFQAVKIILHSQARNFSEAN
ncbi:MAG: hypothetical protein A3G49_03680 [Candidatus Sungbacteria bacterium RIFCSPLOWO2_12_FULL_41_11]|uniref:Uncharacterized protein n=1 Tax=Candidatus Sungbacteria bacterium RIFCSPLOWO2_12_FULL_41_11 TaxID=1802286 RepID=A0A1G2LPW7_9BACT|nr:MAG: hypothetical protein A3G49_03680 [Candidatus Sungbacteria bacterium RIFCSPLOWO2_12_FULL_41_11]